MFKFQHAETGVFVVLTLMALSAFASPERSKGISMHLLPKRVADLSGGRWGLTVDRNRQQPALQLVSDFLEFVHRQDKSAQENGVWIVTTHPDAYSEVEQRFMEDVKTACRREKITLFVARASDLPDGWHKIE